MSQSNSGAWFTGMSLFGGKNAPNTTPKCFQTQHRRKILEVEVQALKTQGRLKLVDAAHITGVKGQNDRHWIMHEVRFI